MNCKNLQTASPYLVSLALLFIILTYFLYPSTLWVHLRFESNSVYEGNIESVPHQACMTWEKTISSYFLVCYLVMMAWPKFFSVSVIFLVELGERWCVCPSCGTHDDIDCSATVFSRRRTGWPCAMRSKHTSVHASSCQCLFQPLTNGISSGCCVWCEECYKQIWTVSPQVARSVQVFL